MTHNSIEHELNEADPRQRSSDMDDDRGNVEGMDDQEDMDDEPISDTGDDEDSGDEDSPSSNERRGYGHVPRQR